MFSGTTPERSPFAPPPRHPTPFAMPLMAVAVAAAVFAAASYAGYLRGNVYEELDKDYRVNDFGYIVTHSALKSSFQEQAWSYTVVAPTDEAFAKAQRQADDDADDPRYHDISAYDYVLSTPVYPDDIKFGEHVRIPSLSGQDLVFTRVTEGEDGLRVNGLPVATVRVANNGVIYLINDIIPFLSEEERQMSWNDPVAGQAP